MEKTRTMTNRDLATLNRTLAERAQERRARCRPPESFDSFFSKEYLSKNARRYLDAAEGYKDINYYFDIDGNGLKTLVKRLIRKANKFLFLQNMDLQRNFNDSLLQANLILHRQLDAMQQQHERELRSLEERLRMLEDCR